MINSDRSAGNVKVSVAMITYNHEPFIAQAIESVLMQQTNFEYELIIGEDCSTDGTLAIARSYAERHPQRMRLLLRDRNQGTNVNLVNTLTACRGEYIAILEGDDYWTDPCKLQKQVEFLENHQEYSMCGTNFSVVDAAGKLIKRDGWWGNTKNKTVSHLTILGSYVPLSLTVLIRNSALPDTYPKEFYSVLNADMFLFALVTRFADAAYMDMNTGCYRFSHQGIWSSLNNVSKREAHFSTLSMMLNYFSEPDEQYVIKSRLSRVLRRQLALYLTHLDAGKLWQTNSRLTNFGMRRLVYAWTRALGDIFLRRPIT